MRKISILRCLVVTLFGACVVPTISAQNQIQVYGPVDVRLSADGTGYGSSAVVFNSSTLNLNCSASPVTAVLSSTPDSKGNLLVDNFINLTVTSASSTTGPVNVCSGATSTSAYGVIPGSCFTSSYQSVAGSPAYLDPDTFVATGGVAPINISSNLQSGPQQLKIDLVDTGGYLANSTLYLNTNCTLTGVTGPAEITGNPIPQSNPTSQQLTQNFSFNPTTNQQVKFVYDLTAAQTAGSLTITPGTIPGTADLPVDATTFQSTLVANTSFATSVCLIHTGELVNNAPACKLFTLACTVGTGANESGAQCPVSSLPNEIFQDVFDGPSFTLPDISTPQGQTFHQGIGLLMASEGWTGGPCTFDPASNLQNLPCPQNLLATFSGPGTYTATGHTSHPNSTFIAVAQVPEDLTTVTVAGQQPGGWIHSSTASLTLSSQPPVLTGTNVPGAANFVAAPIQSITYGISAPTSVPLPVSPVSTDTTIVNSIACPTPANPLDPPATVFTTAAQGVSGLADGNYLLHYYAQDCAGTLELKFSQDNTGTWSTAYYTFPINVDTIAPIVASGPTLSPTTGAQNSYNVGQAVTATYSCTDERSGVIQCGSSHYPYTAGILNTGPITSAVDTSTAGAKTYTVTAVDAAGNQSSASVNYVVVAYDTAIHFNLFRSTVTYPQGSNAFVSIAPTNGHIPTGTIQLLDGATPLQSAELHRDGRVLLHIRGLSVGVHELSIVYSGDAFNPAGRSAPIAFTVVADEDDQ